MIGFVGIFLICVLSALLVVFLLFLVVSSNDWEIGLVGQVVLGFLGIACVISFLAVGVGIDNNGHKTFVSSYNAQKFTIEQSLKNDSLTGFERIELVKQASELNGELAARKTRIQQWNYFHVDDSIYDGVEYITLEV